MTFGRMSGWGVGRYPLFPSGSVGSMGIYNNVFNVKDYGAVGNSSTDDTTALQAASLAASATGGTVYVPIGTYITTGLLLFRNNVTWRGDGYESVIYLKSGSNNNIFTATTNVAFCGWENLRLEGNKSGQTSGSEAYGICSEAVNTDDCWVNHCWINATLRSGIYLVGQRNSVVDCKVTNVGDNTTPGHTGIVLGTNTGSGYGRITGNFVSLGSEYGIKLYANMTYTTIANNVITGTGKQSIYVMDASYVSIADNTCSGGTVDGILVESIATNMTNVAVTGNIVYGNTLVGIIIWNGGNSLNDTVVVGNTVSGNATNGIVVQNATRTVITGNIVTLNGSSGQNDGINVLSAPHTVISGNLIANNSIGATGGCGIREWNVGTSNVIVSGNQIYDNGTGFQTTAVKSVGTSDYWKVHGNDFTGSSIGTSLVGTHNSVTNNMGWLTENSGTATITTGNTSIVVTHGLAFTPTAANVSVVLTNAPTTWPGNFYVDTFTSTQFTIHCQTNPGASGAIFAWFARSF